MLENNKIFIGGINYSTTEETLLEAFAQFGQIINVRIVRDHETGKSKGFAFITFADDNGAELACKEMHSKPIDGRVVGVKIAFNKRTGI